MSVDFQTHIADVLGYDAPACIEPGRLHRFGKNKCAWCKLFEDGRGGVFGDWRAGITDTWSLVDKRTMTPAERAAHARQIALAAHERELQQQQRYATNRIYIAELMGQTKLIAPGDPVARYLERRGLAGARHFASSLRLHSGLVYLDEGVCIGVFPALLAPLLAPDGSLVAVHRTYLTDDGEKADVPTVKKLTPAAGSLRGAAIRLQAPRGGVLGVAEGIETALAAAMASGLPTWSTYSAGGLAGFAWPQGVRKLVVFGDADEAGRKAASALLDRARTAGLAASAVFPSIDGADWADVYAAGGGK